MLASDLDNPEYVGAKNPDSMLAVEFYDHAAEDTWATRETGIKTYKKECPFVRIAIPGNKDLTIERPADNSDLKRFPREWLHYQMATGKIANAENVPGWQIDSWSELVPEQVRQLKFLRFYTVEQIAGANDAQIQGIGMGGLGLRTKARAALEERNGRAVKDAVAERDNEIKGLKDQMAEMHAMLAKLMPQSAATPETAPADEKLDFDAPKRGPGRPPKQEAA